MTSTLTFQISATAPTAKTEAVAKRKCSAAKRIVKAVQVLFDHLEPQDLERVATQLEKVTQTPDISDAEAAFAAELAGRQFTKEERLALELAALKQYFEWRRTLLDGALTAAQVAELLGTTRQTPHDRVKSGSLLAILDNGVWRFPRWQFDPQGPDGVIPGLPEVLKALDVLPLSKLSWLVRPNAFLDGLRPIDALKQGQKERVITEARGVGAA